VAVALDRQEKTSEDGRDGELSAVQYVSSRLGLAVCALATLDDLLQYLRSTNDPALQMFAEPVQAYRNRYGTS
jgi:orotate phosphoribosyltransferase